MNTRQMAKKESIDTKPPTIPPLLLPVPEGKHAQKRKKGKQKKTKLADTGPAVIWVLPSFFQRCWLTSNTQALDEQSLANIPPPGLEPGSLG